MAIAHIDKHLRGGKNNKGISSRGYPNLASALLLREVYPYLECGIPHIGSGVVPNRPRGSLQREFFPLHKNWDITRSVIEDEQQKEITMRKLRREVRVSLADSHTQTPVKGDNRWNIFS